MDEARIARTLTSPHALRVFDVDLDAGHVPYLVQEYLDGEPLSRILGCTGRLEPGRAIAIALQIAEGIEEAHGKSIVHGCLGPSNIMLVDRQGSDFVKILGTGTATRAITGEHATGIAGEEAYAAPERAAGGKVDQRSDMYAFGVLLHAMLAGERPGPWQGVDPSLHEISQDLVDLVEMMTEPDPARRPGSMGKVIELLEQAARDQGLNMDITGRIMVPEECLERPAAAEQPASPDPVPPEVPDSPPQARAKGRSRIHPGLIALAAAGSILLLLVAGLWVLHGMASGGKGPGSAGPRVAPAIDAGIVLPALEGETRADAGSGAAGDPRDEADAAVVPDVPAEVEGEDSAKVQVHPKKGGPGRKGGGKKSTPWTKL